jgi:polyisoprenoid-binding protein YceI
MKTIAIYLICFLASALAFAQTRHKVIKGDVEYSIKNLSFNSTGTFGGLEATVIFDKDHLATSKIDASVEVKTLDSGSDGRDEHLKKPEYFDAEHYPKIIMKSISLKANGANSYSGIFDVTIKGKTKRVDLPFTYVVTGSTAAFKGSFKINRLDFEVGDKSMVLSNEVTVTLNVTTAL